MTLQGVIGHHVPQTKASLHLPHPKAARSSTRTPHCPVFYSQRTYPSLQIKSHSAHLEMLQYHRVVSKQEGMACSTGGRGFSPKRSNHCIGNWWLQPHCLCHEQATWYNLHSLAFLSASPLLPRNLAHTFAKAYQRKRKGWARECVHAHLTRNTSSAPYQCHLDHSIHLL